jgi:ESCRT-I complex subunit VPS28
MFLPDTPGVFVPLLRAELYATIKALEKLERAYTRSDISSQDYTSACHTHISQARTIFDTLRANYPDMRTFMEAHRMTCERAANRLQRGVPATLEHGDDMTRDDSRRVAADSSACTEAFITLGDLLTMHADGVAVDDLTDPLQVLIGRLNRAQYFVPQLEAKQKLLQWSAKLVGMRAADVVGPGDVRQLRLDVNNGYQEFLDAMKG